jgi:hypothetical protein
LNSKNVEVYRDDKARFIFQYPNSWSRVPATHERTRIKIVSGNGAGGEDCGVNVQIDESLRKYSTQQVVRQMLDAPAMQQAQRVNFPDAKILDSGFTTISHQDAVFYIIELTWRNVGVEIPMKMITVQTVRDERVFTLTCRGGKTEFERAMPIFGIIFSGFLIKN